MSDAVATKNTPHLSWRAFFYVWGKRCFLVFLSLILIGVTYEQWGRWRADTVFPVQGKLIDVQPLPNAKTR